jgi:lysophospholipase L1-like esterase
MKTFLLLLVLVSLQAASQPFIEEIKEFKRQDSLHFPPKKANLFIGSSSFRLWPDIQKSFPDHKVINRGFGGSSLPDVIRYVNEIVFPYRPKQVVVYCGENDLAASDTVSAKTVADRFVQLFSLIRSKWKKIPVVFVSIKPSPSREHLFPKMIEANRLIKEFLSTQRNTKFIDVFSLMLDADGKPRKELFVSDMLHMNATGYAIWQKELEPVLKD